MDRGEESGMENDRPFAELNLWQRIFAEQWEGFSAWYEDRHGHSPPEHWQENVDRMLHCGDVREGYNEYVCQDCQRSHRVGHTCKSRLCVRCVKSSVDDFLCRTQELLFPGVQHRQIVLTITKELWPLLIGEPEFLKVYAQAGANAIKELVAEWRPKKKLKVGLMGVIQTYGRSGGGNPHLHFVVTEGGVDENGKWHGIGYFDHKKLRRKWQYHVLTNLKKAVKGTEYEAEWYGKLGSMFTRYPNGFAVDVDLKEKERGPVERLVVYLVKYVSSPPISIRRIESYDSRTVTFRYDDHRRGATRETLPVYEFLERMLQHLPPKGFRRVRYWGLYARPVHRKFRKLLADTLAGFVRQAKRVADLIARRKGVPAAACLGEVRQRFMKKDPRCPHCGSTRLVLMYVWSRKYGMLYDVVRDSPTMTAPSLGAPSDETDSTVDAAIVPEQLVLAF